MNLRFLSLLLALGWIGSWPAWGQAAGESSAAPAAEPAIAVDAVAADSGEQRSALWQAVEAGRQPALSAEAVADRRLTPEQRVELRHQVRQAWRPADASAPATPAEPEPAQP